MNPFESIKGNKRMSLNHWRYRLLHWTFDCSHVNQCQWSSPEVIANNTELPLFLYTHYCPLFHLTNLIAILVPLILFIRGVIVLVKTINVVLNQIQFRKIFTYFKRKKVDAPSTITKTPPCRRSETKEVIRLIIDFIKHRANNSFVNFWVGVEGKFSVLMREEIEKLYDEYLSKILEAQRISQIRRERWRQRVVFWSYFSSVFLKWVMNLSYVGLAILVIWLTSWAAMPFWSLLCWIVSCVAWFFTNEGFLVFVLLTVKLLVGLFLLGGIFYTTIKLFQKVKILQVVGESFYQGVVWVAPPFYLAAVPFMWIGRGFRSLCEFVEVFYEENCPPITLVSEEEAVVENEISNEGM